MYTIGMKNLRVRYVYEHDKFRNMIYCKCISMINVGYDYINTYILHTYDYISMRSECVGAVLNLRPSNCLLSLKTMQLVNEKSTLREIVFLSTMFTMTVILLKLSLVLTYPVLGYPVLLPSWLPCRAG